jgi:hypothetical protein
LRLGAFAGENSSNWFCETISFLCELCVLGAINFPQVDLMLSFETENFPVLPRQPVHGLRLALIHLQQAFSLGVLVRGGAGN